MMGWDYWQTLLAVFRGGNFATAARSLNVDPTTVGRRLKTLERRMGYALFLRNEGRLYPTSECEELLTHLEDAFESLRRAEQRSDAAARGIIWRLARVTAPPFMVNNIYSPAAVELGKLQRLQLELIGTGSYLNLTRREADIAIRIEDHPASVSFDTANIIAEKLGSLLFAVYQRNDLSDEDMPWAGLADAHVRTTGTNAMLKLAGKQGLQIRVSQFDALIEVIASGAARGLLPCFMGDPCEPLVRCSDVILEQPLWMLFHRQDLDSPHQQTTREWLVHQTRAKL